MFGSCGFCCCCLRLLRQIRIEVSIKCISQTERIEFKAIREMINRSSASFAHSNPHENFPPPSHRDVLLRCLVPAQWSWNGARK